MKKVFLSFLLVALMLPVSIFAAAVKTTPSPTDMNKAQEQIDSLKTRIASRVAELNLVVKKGTIGIVTDSSNTELTIKDLSGNVRYIDVDELTKFSSSGSNSFGISDVKKGMTIGAVGLYNKQSRRILARGITVLTLPKTIVGVISSIDSKNYNFNVLTEKEEIAISVENITKTASFSLGGQLVNSGFSKIKVDQNVIVIGTVDKQDKNKIIASRIIIFPDLPRNPLIKTIENALEQGPTIVPSTGSGHKLTPIVK